MNIVFVSDNFPPEGNAPATRLWEHAKYWVAQGHRVTVLTCAPNFPEGRVLDGYRNAWRTVEYLSGIRVVRVKTYISANEGSVRRILDYLSFMVTSTVMGAFEEAPDVVVASSPQFFAAPAGYMLARRFRKPFVLEIRDLWPASIVAVGALKESPMIRALELLELSLYRLASRVVVVTESFKRDLVMRGIPTEKIAVVLNGVDLDAYNPQSLDDSRRLALGLADKFVAAYVGTHGMAHGLDRVLDAAKLLESDNRIRFLFAGAGAQRAAVEARVSEEALRNVVLLPRQPKEEMPKLWGACDVALVPLRDQEVFRTVIPSKIFEAMAMGKPVLASIPRGEATELVDRMGCGVCIEPEKPDKLAEAILRLSRDPSFYHLLSSNGLKGASRFSRDHLAEAMLGVLNEATRAYASRVRGRSKGNAHKVSPVE